MRYFSREITTVIAVLRLHGTVGVYRGNCVPFPKKKQLSSLPCNNPEKIVVDMKKWKESAEQIVGSGPPCWNSEKQPKRRRNFRPDAHTTLSRRVFLRDSDIHQLAAVHYECNTKTTKPLLTARLHPECNGMMSPTNWQRLASNQTLTAQIGCSKCRVWDSSAVR